MSGHNTGLQDNLIKEDNSLALFKPYAAHSLNFSE